MFMAIRIDENLLVELGLGSLPKPEKDKLLRHIYETLETRVGMKLAERMSDEQLDEFEQFIDTNDEKGALGWLEANFPNYPKVVAEELEKLKVEVKQNAEKIIQSASGNIPGDTSSQPTSSTPPAQ